MLSLALDLGGTSAKGALVKSNGRILFKTTADSAHWGTPAAVVAGLAQLVKTLVEQSGGKHIRGVGLGIPGPIDVRKGLVMTTPNLPFKKPYPIKKELERRIKMPVFLQNDANCAALGEATWGAARRKKIVVMITLGTGVGGGVIIDGNIFDGVNGQGAELGHVPVCADAAVVCGAGHHGCLESLVKKDRIIALGKEWLGQTLDPLAIEKSARGGNKKALGIYQEVGRMIGIAFGGFASIFNPDVIIIGGGMSPAFDLMRHDIMTEMRRYSFPTIVDAITLIQAQLGNDAGILGSAQLVFEYAKTKK